MSYAIILIASHKCSTVTYREDFQFVKQFIKVQITYFYNNNSLYLYSTFKNMFTQCFAWKIAKEIRSLIVCNFEAKALGLFSTWTPDLLTVLLQVLCLFAFRARVIEAE